MSPGVPAATSTDDADVTEVLAALIRVMHRHRAEPERRQALIDLFANFSYDLCEALNLDHDKVGREARALSIALAHTRGRRH